MSKYRIFISYSRKESPGIARVIRDLCEEHGFHPIWDEDFRPGTKIREEIHNCIRHAHLFLPILSENDSNLSWVHEEIGYALGCRIPVIPITLGEKPIGFLEVIKAQQLPNNCDEVHDCFKRIFIDSGLLLSKIEDTDQRPVYESAEFREDRTSLLIEYSERVLRLNRGPCMLRQMAALSSFHIPNKPANDHVWDLRYDYSNSSRHIYTL